MDEEELNEGEFSEFYPLGGSVEPYDIYKEEILVYDEDET